MEIRMTIIGMSLLPPFAVYLGGVLFIIAMMYGVAFITGERHKSRDTDRVYESGIEITGSARTRYSAQFYLIAILFVIFDLEVIFLFAWAVSAREAGIWGYIGMIIFAGIIIIGLVYEWRMGALTRLWEKRGKPFIHRMEKS
jgi:NADH-quinone oxidoreductase subunit A